MRDGWIIYAVFGLLVCLLLWRVATQRDAGILRSSLIIFGIAALVVVVWQGARLLGVGATTAQDKTITVFAAASLTNALDDVDRALAGDGRVATGDAREVPVGLYAKATLERLGAWAAVEPKMVMAEDVRAALRMVARGQAPLGIVYETDAKIEPAVKVIGVFPDNTHDPIIYPVALRGNTKPDAVRYFSFLQTQTAKSVFEKYSFKFLVKPTL